MEKLAAEAGFTLLALSPSSILSKWSGESEKALGLAFDVARAMSPAVRCVCLLQLAVVHWCCCRGPNGRIHNAAPTRSKHTTRKHNHTQVLFLDEVDALGRARSGGGDDAAPRRLLTELLLQLNGLGEDEGVYVFGATNRMADCDPALLRRFERCGARARGLACRWQRLCYLVTLTLRSGISRAQ